MTSELMYKGFLGIYLETEGTKNGAAFLTLIILGFLVITILPYLLGSLNFSIIISKLFYHEDIRIFGSGNAGMTNMLRTYGKGAAALTLLCDALKAVVSVMLGRLIFGIVGAYAAGLACVLGHVFPVFYKFKGGKGVICTMITIFMTNWKVGLILFVIFLLLVAATKFISLGSVMCMLIYPLVLYRINSTEALRPDLIVMLFAFALTVIVVLKHTSNIKRLIAGTENKVSFSKINKKSADDKAEEK